MFHHPVPWIIICSLLVKLWKSKYFAYKWTKKNTVLFVDQFIYYTIYYYIAVRQYAYQQHERRHFDWHCLRIPSRDAAPCRDHIGNILLFQIPWRIHRTDNLQHYILAIIPKYARKSSWYNKCRPVFVQRDHWLIHI